MQLEYFELHVFYGRGVFKNVLLCTDLPPHGRSKSHVRKNWGRGGGAALPSTSEKGLPVLTILSFPAS